VSAINSTPVASRLSKCAQFPYTDNDNDKSEYKLGGIHCSCLANSKSIFYSHEYSFNGCITRTSHTQ
jgi:hypothetical protein